MNMYFFYFDCIVKQLEYSLKKKLGINKFFCIFTMTFSIISNADGHFDILKMKKIINNSNEQ